MTKIKPSPFLDALAGNKPERTPVWLMRQAGRYLPEYRDLRKSKNGFLDMAYSPDAAMEVTMQPIRRFGMDAAIIFSDILVIPHALGQSLDFIAGEGPKLDPITNIQKIENLSFACFDETLAPVYEALSKTRAALKNEGFEQTALIGFAGSPWTVATYMVEGAGSKDFMNVKNMAYKNPEHFSKIIDLLVEATTKYLCNQIDAGAQAVQLFDSWSGALTPDQFKKWVIKPTRKIVAGVKLAHPDIPIIGFPKGAGRQYKSYALETGINALGLDSQMDTKYAAAELQTIMPVQGNLDPAALFAGGDALKDNTLRILDDLSVGNFIFNLGHGIHKDTPISHVEELIKIIREYKN